MERGPDIVDAALHYASLGLMVFPCKGKVPLTAHGFRDATNDVDKIERWWAKYPAADIGMATHEHLVVDVDGENNLWPNSSEKACDLAACPVSLTPTGGKHYFFRRPAGLALRCTQGKLAPRVDTRADGGYVILPPSANGAYRWATGCCSIEDAPPIPQWLLFALGNSTVQEVAAEIIREGRRNSTLLSLGGTMRRVGMSYTEIAAALSVANRDRCNPPLPESEVISIAKSVAKYEPDQVASAMAEGRWEKIETENVRHMDDSMFVVPGLVSDVMSYALKSAPYPEKTLAFLSGLITQAALCARKVKDAFDNRTNIYVIALANSGTGKEHSRKVIQQVLQCAGMADALNSNIASGEGIEDRLLIHPASVFLTDEIDSLFLKITQARDGRYEGILSTLMQFYSSASSQYVARTRAGREREIVDQPCLILYGTAIPRQFRNSITQRFVLNGFIPRTILVECGLRGTMQSPAKTSLADSILSVAKYWADFRSPGNLSCLHPEPMLVPNTHGAEKVFADFAGDCDRIYAECEMDGDACGMATWARCVEKSRRLSLIYACSANHIEPVIDEQAAIWATNFIAAQTRHFSSGNIGESEFDIRCNLLIETLRKWREKNAGQWMPFWRVCRALPWSKKQHGEIRETLVERKVIEVATTKTTGRPGMSYRLC